jgi:hypothetical protein
MQDWRYREPIAACDTQEEALLLMEILTRKARVTASMH